MSATLMIDGLQGLEEPAFTLLSQTAVKGAALLAVGLAAAAVWRGAPAAARRLLLALSFLDVLLLPVLAGVLPAWEAPLLPARPALESGASAPGLRQAPGAPETAIVPEDTGPLDPDSAASAAGSPALLARAAGARGTANASAGIPPRWPRALLLVWGAGVFACLLPYLAGTRAARRLCRRGAPVPHALAEDACTLARSLGLRRAVPLLLSESARVPLCLGIRRPRIVLPPDFTSWPEPMRRAVLLHELAHVRRRDCLARLLARLCIAFHWFNPLAWAAARRLRLESERACDDLVLASGIPPADYGGWLLEIARSLGGARPPAGAIAAARRSGLESRLRAILAAGLPRRDASHPEKACGAALLAAAVLALAPLRLVTPEAGVPARDGDRPVITVAAGGGAMHASIQKAVDAAPAGAVIRIAPGTYEERVVIQKPLTLEGAGPGRTRLVSRTVNIAAEIRKDKNLMAELERRYREAGSEAERRAMFRAIARELKEKHGLQPTVLVRAAEGVAIRDLRITLLGEREEGKKGLGAALELDRARVKVSGCAIAGSSANGVVASAGSTLEMEKCLVAGVWGTGILLEAVEAADGPPAPHRVSDCDVRHCYHRGIVIGAGNDAATVERCRISGSAWHGIRYDDASPAISGNAIFANARFGIYASGKTAAAVRGNLFVANAMAGVSCWFESRDRIEGNTFALNRRAGVEALRASKPEVRGNIFFAQPTAVFFEDRGSLAAGAASEGRAALERNLFWQNDKKTVWPPPPPGEEPAAETPLSAEGDGNVEDDPGFQSVEVQDFTLTADSPARRDRLGAADPIPLDSPWPPQPEEEAVRAALSRQD